MEEGELWSLQPLDSFDPIPVNAEVECGACPLAAWQH